MDDRMTPGSIRAMWAKGLNNTQIAQHYGVTKQAVSDTVRRYDMRRNDPRKMAVLAFPWKLRFEHKDASPAKRLREHARFYFAGEKDLTDLQLRRLLGFYIHLRDAGVVVEYDPTYEGDDGPSGRAAGTATGGGWRWRSKEPSDGDLIVRLNEYATPMDEKTLEVWRFPDQLPTVR